MTAKQRNQYENVWQWKIIYYRDLLHAMTANTRYGYLYNYDASHYRPSVLFICVVKRSYITSYITLKQILHAKHWNFNNHSHIFTKFQHNKICF